MHRSDAFQAPTDRMPEAEVALRLAEYISELPGFEGHVAVAIDGASVKVQKQEVFDIVGYLSAQHWQQSGPPSAGRNAWTMKYERHGATLEMHSSPGKGDVEARVAGRRVIAECKKGPLIRKPGSPEYPLLTTAIGQALLFKAEPDDIVVAAVPDTPTFRRVATEWGQRPRMLASGIRIALVSRSGAVSGLQLH